MAAIPGRTGYLHQRTLRSVHLQWKVTRGLFRSVRFLRSVTASVERSLYAMDGEYCFGAVIDDEAAG